MSILASELRHALRGLRRTPTFTFAAVATLALAIGATTAVYSAADAVLLRPLATASTSRLVQVEANMPAMSLEHMPLAPGEMFDLAKRRDLFEGVAGYRVTPLNLTGAGEPQRVTAVNTVGSMFGVLGVRPFLGRLYDSTEAANGDHHVAVLTHDFWQSLTGGDVNVIGRSLTLDGAAYRVIGVLPPGFDFPHGAQLWTPQPPFPGFDDPTNRCCKYLTTVARIRPDVGHARIATALAAEQQAWQEQYPKIYAGQMNGGAKVHRQTLSTVGIADSLAGSLRPIVLLLLGAIGFVLLIACSNVASLQLVRTATRAREIAVRTALGASRGRIVRQVGLESLLIALCGGVAGVALGSMLLGAVRHFGTEGVPALEHVALNPAVLAVAALTTLLVALVFGVVPARRAASIDPAMTLGASPRGASLGVARSRTLRTGVVVQVSLALALLLGSLVALRSLERLVAVNPGFNADGVVRMRLALPPEQYASKQSKIAFSSQMLDRLRAVPGVTAVGTVMSTPFGYMKANDASTIVQAARGGAPTGPDAHASLWVVDGDYFKVMGIPLRGGRTFSPGLDSTSPPEWLIDETLSRKLFGNGNPIGREMLWSTPAPSITGVVGAVKKTDLAAADVPSVYWSFRQYPQGDISVVVRSPLPLATLEPSLRAAIRAIDPAVPVFDFMTMDDAVSRSLGPRRLASVVLGGFAVLALTLALCGIFGVLSYATAQRRKELGIRLALGASPRDLVRMVVGDGVRVATIGTVAGAAVYIAVARLLGSIVYGVDARDPLMLVGAAVFVLLIATAASWLPAWRGSRTDPLEALRVE